MTRSEFTVEDSWQPSGWCDGLFRWRLDQIGVEVWLLDLGAVAREKDAHWQWLSATERARADRFRDRCARWRYVGGRWLLRRVLAGNLAVRPDQLRFAPARNGKLELTWPQRSPQFNLSHSGDRVLLIVAADRQVGVDIERRRPEFPWAEIADRVLTPLERLQLAQAPTARRSQLLTQLWTRKEALLKATGVGLAGGMNGLQVGLGPQGDLSLGRVPPGRLVWVDLPVDAGYRAALAYGSSPGEREAGVPSLTGRP